MCCDCQRDLALEEEPPLALFRRSTGTLLSSILQNAIAGGVMEPTDGVLEKAEGYFGRSLTRIGLAIIALGALSASLKAIWENALSPVWIAFKMTGLTVSLAISLISSMLVVLLASALIDQAIQNHKYKKRVKKLDELLIRAERARDKVEANFDRIERSERSVREQLAAAELMIETTTLILRDQGVIGEQKAQQILSLLDASLPPLEG